MTHMATVTSQHSAGTVHILRNVNTTSKNASELDKDITLTGKCGSQCAIRPARLEAAQCVLTSCKYPHTTPSTHCWCSK